jgi:NodT family efflux transporter outer membrane factor (OMF) lipoprotein
VPTLLLPFLLAACAVGPDYVRPTVETPAAFKEMQGWKTAQPRDQEIRGKWWQAFNDPLLDALEEQVSVSNQNLATAAARFRQAQGLVQAARAGYFPRLTATAAADRSSAGGRSVAGGAVIAGGPVNTHSITFDAVWEADLWGKIGRTVESTVASAQASAADLESTRLSMQAQLAQNYFMLRAADAQQELLNRTVEDYRRSVQLTENQYAAGVAARENVVLAQTQLQTTLVQAIDIGLQRAQLEHAIALLIGKPASDFSLDAAKLTSSVPALPVGLPSTLLERRPDVAAAERRVASANAQIGVAKSAYFPDLTLSASGGFQGSGLGNWLSLPTRFWAIGPALAQTLFDAGARRAQTEQAIAAFDASVATYRQTVLTGFQEAEDSLAALRILEQEAQTQEEALRLARRSVELTTNQYKAGLVSYLNVVTVQTTALNSERNSVDLQSRRLLASVQLIKALGGGWDAAALAE